MSAIGERSVDLRRNAPSSGPPVVLAAGDLVCGSGTSSSAPCQHAAVAGLVSAIAPDAVLLLGDIQYEKGTLADFNAYFDVSWRTHKALIRPAPGNHEYNTSDAKGYYDYFNGVGVEVGAAGDRSKGYYSYNLGRWHVIAINSNCSAIGGCGRTSAQVDWLRADLAANPAECTLAYWHHPRFSSGSHGNDHDMQTVWQVLYDAGADVVLSGHDHDYERFAPQTATGALDVSNGIRSFVVGTGGKEQRSFGTIRANSEFRSNTSLGLLKLTLRDGAFDWAFQPIPGHTLADAGSASCVGVSAA